MTGLRRQFKITCFRMRWLVGSLYRDRALFSMIPTYFLSLSLGRAGVEQGPDACSAQNLPQGAFLVTGWHFISPEREKNHFYPFTCLATQAHSEFVMCVSALETCTSDRRVCMWLSACMLCRKELCRFPLYPCIWELTLFCSFEHPAWRLSDVVCL